MRLISLSVCSVALCAALALPASAKPALRDVPEIDDTLMMIAIADEIRKECDDISARMIRAMTTIRKLKARALELGYSEEEIEDYVTSKVEKQRMRVKAEAWLAARGVNPGKSASMCPFGQDQITKATAIGVLLR